MDISQFIRDTCLFTSRDMGYLVPPPLCKSHIYIGYISFQNGACFHGVAHENTLRHNEVTWSEIFLYFNLIFP